MNIVIFNFAKNYLNIYYLKNYNIRGNILIKGRKYLNRCLKEELNRIYPNFDNPRVSVIIPLYNSQNTIKQAIKSIQNQKMIDIEIVLVNLFYLDYLISSCELKNVLFLRWKAW